MKYYQKDLNILIENLKLLPSIGEKMASRIAMHIIGMEFENVQNLSESIINAKKNVKFCKECFNFSDEEICGICLNVKRDKTKIMVLENTRDLQAYEASESYTGLYHVLHGAIDPSRGIGANEIKLKELMSRLSRMPEVTEVILATNSTVQGETTAMYISKLLVGTNITVSKIASGVPVGGDIENVDEVTLLKALEGRVILK